MGLQRTGQNLGADWQQQWEIQYATGLIFALTTLRYTFEYSKHQRALSEYASWAQQSAYLTNQQYEI